MTKVFRAVRDRVGLGGLNDLRLADSQKGVAEVSAEADSTSSAI